MDHYDTIALENFSSLFESMFNGDLLGKIGVQQVLLLNQNGLLWVHWNVKASRTITKEIIIVAQFEEKITNEAFIHFFDKFNKIALELL